MLVKEKIKGLNDNCNFIVTQDGKFLIIKLEDRDIHFTNNKEYTEEKILNMKIKKVQLLNGIVSDILAIRV